MSLTPEQHDKIIKDLNRQYHVDGMRWLERQLKIMRDER
jgi:hypothetical protein